MTKRKKQERQWSALTLLWDADGTLLFSQDWWEYSLYLTAEYFGFTVPEGPELKRTFAGLQLKEIYEKVVPQGLDIRKCLEYHAARQAETMHLITLFEHEYETLRAFDELGIKQGIVTARTRRATLVQSLRDCNIFEFFKCIVCMQDVKVGKPDPEGINRAIELLGADRSQTFMIGDTVHDINAGKNAGIKTIGTLFGYEYEKDDDDFLSAGADYYVLTYKALESLVLSNFFKSS